MIIITKNHVMWYLDEIAISLLFHHLSPAVRIEPNRELCVPDKSAVNNQQIVRIEWGSVILGRYRRLRNGS